MEKLRSTLALGSRWQPYGVYVDRIEAYLETDFSVAVENAKALLEGIAKEICDSRQVALGAAPSINSVLKKAFVSLGYQSDELVTQVSGALATIGQSVGSLRNAISPTSHGKSSSELNARNQKVDLLTREFLIDSTLVVAVFLVRAFEERNAVTTQPGASASIEDQDLVYDHHEDFNGNWDDIFGEFAMGSYRFTASEILFAVDTQAYATELKAYQADLTEEPHEAPGEAV
jgi:hypothetical protein